METTEKPDPPKTIIQRLVGGPRGFRRLLVRLGPTYVKVGQFLALRPDLIPQEYTDELLELFDDVEVVLWSDVQKILHRELPDFEEKFEFIDPHPVASGSLAQVHRAVLPGGRQVAIKVLRPNIRERVETDLRRARTFAKILRLAHITFVVDPKEVFEELSAWLHQEIDLETELNNLIQLRELAGESEIEFIPDSFPELSTSRILTTEFVQGNRFSTILTDRNVEIGIREHERGIDLGVLAENLIQATLRQMFEYQFFHADIHPGNIIAMPDNKIGYVDFGLCEYLDDNIRHKQIQYLSAVYEGDVSRIFRALLEILVPTDDSDARAFRSDFNEECANWLSRDKNTYVKGRSPMAHWLVGVMTAARKNHFRIPARLLAMYRTLLTAETIANRLCPRIDIRAVGYDLLLSFQLNDALRALQPKALRQLVPDLISSGRDSPRHVNQLLSELSEGKFTLNVEWTDDARTRRDNDRRTRLLATAIASVGVAFLLAIPALWQDSSPFLRFVLSGMLVSLYISIILQWRRLR